MFKNNLLIVSSSHDEAITQCVINNKTKFYQEIEIILLEELLNTYEINDEINDIESIVRWTDPHGRVISNQDHMILNRVTHIPAMLFEKFNDFDKRYARSEFEAYLGFAVNSFRGVSNEYYSGRCGEYYSLPEQWLKMNNIPNLKIPDFYWGPSEFNVLKDNEELIESDINNLFNWKFSYETKSGHRFLFKKPAGSPVFTFNIGKQTMIDSIENVNESIRCQLFEFSSIIRERFKYFIFEVLFFIENNSITFGCVNHNIIKSRNNEEFEKFTCENLLEEYFRCCN